MAPFHPSNAAASQANRWLGLDAASVRVAEFLERRGRWVEHNVAEGMVGAGRQGDTFVDGLKTEIKTMSAGGTQADMIDRGLEQIHNARRWGGQAEHVIIDARGTELSEQSASTIIARWFGKSDNTVSIEVIGDDFFISPYEPFIAPAGIPMVSH